MGLMGLLLTPIKSIQSNKVYSTYSPRPFAFRNAKVMSTSICDAIVASISLSANADGRGFANMFANLLVHSFKTASHTPAMSDSHPSYHFLVADFGFHNFQFLQSLHCDDNHVVRKG